MTLEKLLEPYRPLLEPTIDDEDANSERARLIPSIEARQALSTLKLYIQQQWDPGMLSLAFEVEDDTGIAVQKDIYSLECHLSILQLRRAQKQTPITSYFQSCGAAEGVAQEAAAGSTSTRGAGAGGAGAESLGTGASAGAGEGADAGAGVKDMV